MFDAFVRFAYGIISHEASNQGSGSGGQAGYRGRAQPPAPEEEAAPEEWHLDADSLQISRNFWALRVPGGPGTPPYG